MRRTLAIAITVAAICAVLPASQGVAATPGSGAFSAFKGKVSCHWVRSSTVTTVRCWALKSPGQDAAVSTGDMSGRLASKNWQRPVGPAMIFNHQYKLGNGVACTWRWRHVTDTMELKSVICSTSVGGPLIFTTPSGVGANIA